MTSSRDSQDEGHLDGEQRAAVEATERAIAVLAGPGSGKTRTLSFRARHLLEKDAGSNALLLTFTNKAAAEMKSRTLGVAGVPSRRISASTFHTFCADVLRGHGELVGISRDFEILDGKDTRTLSANIVTQHAFSPNVGQQYREYRVRRGALGKEHKRFEELYRKAKKELGAVDFDDLVVLVADLLNDRPDIAQAYATRYGHILIDEFQDTNAAQALLIEKLTQHAKTVSIFADDDQAIFGFAGAEAENIQRFVRATGAKLYPLTVNYRSAGRIVDTANSLISAVPTRSGRFMRAHRGGGSVELRQYSTGEQEAADVSAEIAGLLSRGFTTAQVAVLVRAGWRGDLVVDELGARGIPLSDWRGEAHTPQDRRLLAACLATVRGTLNARQIEVLSNLMEVEPAEAMATEAFLSKYSNQPLAAGLSAMRDLLFSGAAPHQIAKAAMNAVSAQNREIGESLGAVVNSVAHFELYDKEFSLEHLLSELALGSIGAAPAETGGVKVASLHRTKGLQWKRVYLIGLEEGHLPDFRSNSEAQIVEERRLCFVGISRAEDDLVVTTCRTTRGYGKQPSRFIAEMGLR